MKNAKAGALVLPTVVCAWCKGTVRAGGPKVSHGICRPCAKQWFGKMRARITRRPRDLAA